MLIRAYMLSCPEREALRGETLGSFAATDWDGALEVVVNGSDAAARPARIAAGMLGLLRQALAGEGDYFLVCEDDVIFNRHLRHNLARWAPLRAGRVQMASLYNPGVTALAREPQAVAADPETALGAQARLFARGCAEHVVREFRASAWHQDVALARLAAELGPVLYHAPSLVQHAGKASVWGGPWHEARDFAPDWRAE